MPVFKKTFGWMLVALLFLALIFVIAYYMSDKDMVLAGIYTAGAVFGGFLGELFRPLFTRKHKKR